MDFLLNKIEIIINSILFLYKMDYLGYTVFENGDIMGKRGWMLKPRKNEGGYLFV